MKSYVKLDVYETHILYMLYILCLYDVTNSIPLKIIIIE